MSLENIASGLFNFDPTRGLQAGTSMGAQMMQVALQSQQQQLDAGAKWDQAALSADRNALSRRTQMFNEMTQNLNRFDEQAKQQKLESWASGAGGSSSMGGGGGGGGGSSVSYADMPSSGPAQSAPVERSAIEYKEPTALPGGSGFNSEPSQVAPVQPNQEQSITSNIQPTMTPIGGSSPAAVSAPDSSMTGAITPIQPSRADVSTIQGSASARMTDRANGRSRDPRERTRPTNDLATAPQPEGVSFAGGPARTPTYQEQPQAPSITFNEGAHKNRTDVDFDGRPANVRYNNPSAAYPRPRDNAFGLEGYGVIGGGHLIGKYPTPVHGAASNMDLFSTGYKGMTIQGAVNKWRGGNGSLNVPAGYNGGEVIDDSFIKDKGKMVDFFGKMSAHESSQFSMPKEQWEQAYDMYSAGGASPESAQPRQDYPGQLPQQASGGGGQIDAGLFPQSGQSANQPSAQQLYGPQGGQEPNQIDLNQFPEYRASQEARSSYQGALTEKMQNTTKMNELRTNLMQIDQEMLATDSEASSFGAKQSDPLYRVRMNPLRAQRAKIEHEISGIQAQNTQVLEREKVLEKSAKDADAAWKVVQDNQLAYRKTTPDAGPPIDKESMIDAYIDSDPRERIKMRTRFAGDSGLMGSFSQADDYLEKQGAGGDGRTWKIGGDDYSFNEVLQFYTPYDPIKDDTPNGVQRLVESNPKLKAEVMAAKGQSAPTQEVAPAAPATAAVASGADPIKSKIDSLF